MQRIEPAESIRGMAPADWLLLLVLSAIWGGSFFFNGVALKGLPPLVVVFGRVFVGCLGLLAVLTATGRDVRPYLPRWRELLTLGTINTALPFSLIVWGQQYISGGLASVINATTPAFTIMVAHFLTRDEPASVRKLTGAALGLGGVATLIGTQALHGLDDHIFGQLAVMGASVSYAFSVNYARRITGIPPMVMAWGQLAGGSAVMLPLVLFAARPWELPVPSVTVLGAVVGLGLVCSTLAYSIFFPLLKRCGGTNVSLVTLLIAFSASSLGMAFLDEPFTSRLVTGMAIVSTAILLIDGRLFDGRLFGRARS